MEYRELANDDERFAELVRYAFSPDRGPFDPDEFDPADVSDVGAARGLFDGEDLLAVCRHYWFDVALRGRSLGAPGLSAVASPPEHRRGGNVRTLLRESLVEYRDRGDPLSVLWPFSTPFYAQYGWATTNRYAVHDVDPEALAFATESLEARDRTVDFEPVDRDASATVEAVAAVDDRTWDRDLHVNRSEGFWRHRVFESWGTDPYVYLGRRDGDPVAYAVYTIEDDDGDGLDDRKLSVSYFGAVDHDALLGVLSFGHAHDSQVSSVRLKTPTDWGLAHVLDDPGALDTDVRTGPMARVVDATRALEAIPYPAAVDREVVLDVDDPLADWHDDPLRLVVADGDATCERAPDAEPDAALGVGALSQLVVGTRSARDLARTRDLDAADEAVEALADALPPTDPCLLQFF